METANAFTEEFMNDYNRRFSKAPRQEFDVHRELDVYDDLDMVFTWREARRVSKSLTVQYDKVLYLIEDSEFSRRAIGKVNILIFGITLTDIKSSDLMAHHFPTPPMTNCLKPIRVPLWTINVLAVRWKWRNWCRPYGIITGHNQYHPVTALHAGAKPPRRRNHSVHSMRTICSMHW